MKLKIQTVLVQNGSTAGNIFENCPAETESEVSEPQMALNDVFNFSLKPNTSET